MKINHISFNLSRRGVKRMNRDYNYIRNLGRDLLKITSEMEAQDFMIAQLEIRAAEYKAHFYGRTDLAEKLNKQYQENEDYRVGDFDGFCYASWRANAKFRTLNFMLIDCLLTKEEYEFCKVM